MKPSTDRMIEFIAARGETGVTMSELAWEFLRPASARPELCEKVLRGLLEKDPRVAERPDGKWAAVRDEEERPSEGYTVIETLAADAGPRRTIEVEVAALRVGRGGEAGEGLSAAIRPDPWPPNLVLPPRLMAAMTSALTRAEAVEKAARFARGTVLVCYQQTRFVAEVKDRLIKGGTVTPVLQLQRLTRATLGKDAAASREAMAGALGLVVREIATAEEAARAAAEALASFLEEGVVEEDVLAAQHPARHEPDFESFAFTRDDVASLPATPGIYILRDANGGTAYVGKARDLRQRVGSYFRSRIERDARVEAVLESAYTLETRPAGSELEALLMERRAIQDLAPRVNLQFDVHERAPAQRAESRRAVAVLPSVKPRCAELFLVRGTDAFRKTRISGRWAAKVAREINDFFFSPDPKPEGDPGEARIFWSWHAMRRDEARMIDVDAAAGPDDVARLAGELYRDVLKGGEKAFRV